MDFLTPDKVVGTYDLRSDVKNTSTIPPGYVPPLIRGLSLEDSVQSTSWSTSKHKPHTLYLGINQGYNDTSSLDSIFSQSNTLNQNVITTKTTKTISNDKSSHRNKSSTVPNVMKIVRKSYDTLDVGRNRYEKHLKADPELIAQQITLIELEYFQAIEADEFYTLKWNSKEKLQYAPNIVASTRWFNQIIFWVQKHILNEKSLSKRTEILSHFIRMAKKLVDFNNFSSGMAIISALNMQCIHRLNATWSHLTSRDRHIFRKLADLFSQEENFINLRTAVDHSRLPCIPYLGIYLSDLTFIDVAASSLNNRRENSTWTNQGKQDRINNILRIIANFQQSNYPFVRNESIASYLETQRYIEELQRFIEDANYKLSIQLEPPPTSSPPDLSRQNSSYTVPPNYSFLSSINSSNDNILKPVPIYTCTANVTSKCDTVTTTTTPLSPIKTTTSSSSPLSCKTPTMNNKTTRIRHPNKGNTEHMISHSTVNQQIKSNPTLCDLLGPPMIPPPPRVKQTYSQEDISISSSNHNPVVNSVQRPRKKPTHQKLGSWGGFGLLFSDNDATPTIDKTDNKQNSSTSTTSTTTNTGSSSHLLPRSPHFKRNVKLSVNNPESTKNSLSNQNHGFAKRSSPTILKRYMNTNNDNNNNSNTKTSNQPNGDLYFMFDDRPSSNSSRSSPHLLVFTDCLNKPDNNHKQSIKKEQMISGNSMPIYSSSSSNNSVIELQCIKQSKSTHSRNQSSIFPDDISNAKTVPGTPCRRIKQHHNYTNMGMSNLEQKRSTNLTTTDDDDHHHNSTSNGKKISVTKLLHHNSLLNSPSMFYQSSQKDHSFNNCTTPLTNHYRLSQTYPFVLPTSKIRSSSLHLPELSSHHQQQQQQHSSMNLSHLALAALAAVQVTISNNDNDKHNTKDKNVTFVHHRHHHSPVLMSTSNYSCSQSSPINSTYLNIKLANNLEVIREGPLLCCTTSLTSFKIAKFHSSSSVNSSTSPSQLSTSFTDRLNFSTIPLELPVNCNQSPVKHKSNLQPDIDCNLNEIHSPPTITANLSYSYSSQTSLSSMTLESSTSLSYSSTHHNHHHHRHSVHEGEQSIESLNEHLYSPQSISTSCNCKYIKKSCRLHKKFKNYWAVLLISLNNNNKANSISNECVFLVLFKTYTKSLKQFIPWSIVSSNLNPLKIRKNQLLNSPNYYSASRCKVLRIQDACFDKHNTQSLLNDNCIHPTVLVLENYSNKEKVYRLICPIPQYLCTQPMTCRNSNRSSSKIIEHVDQLDVAYNSDIQITNNTHRDVIPSWLWTSKTIHRFSQIIKQKFGTILKINQSKHDLSSNTTTANLTTTPTTTTPTSSNDYLLNKSFQWLYPLLTLFPSASQQLSKHIFQTSSFLNLSTME